MRVVAILEIDEEKLTELSSNFEREMGWVEQSGIRLVEYQEQKEDYEYASFLWSRNNGKYEQVNGAVQTELLCRKRLQEYINNRWLSEDYDTGKIVIKRRVITEFAGKWEELPDLGISQDLGRSMSHH